MSRFTSPPIRFGQSTSLMLDAGASPSLPFSSRIRWSAANFPSEEYGGTMRRRPGTRATHVGEKSRRTVAGSSKSSTMRRGVQSQHSAASTMLPPELAAA